MESLGLMLSEWVELPSATSILWWQIRKILGRNLLKREANDKFGL